MFNLDTPVFRGSGEQKIEKTKGQKGEKLNPDFLKELDGLSAEQTSLTIIEAANGRRER